MSKKKRTFEDDLKRLEELVRSLEQNELTLEESLAAFEEGSELGDALMKELNRAQERVAKLVKSEQGEFELKPFDEDPDG